MTTKLNRLDAISSVPNDHHFILNESCISIGSAVHKQIMKEWKLLQHLPDSISVMIFENRIDLLRAVIVGAAGTPYHDGLFFFDIAFPSDYPAKPPLVKYFSYGLRLNPNLYANGVVCLSLLNTWLGSKREKWNPAESTILQVLVSIQALVLNEMPYFNEPLPSRLITDMFKKKKSYSYNEQAFILSCKTMLYMMRTPPRNFESFVTVHFQERAKDILMACKSYACGEVGVGYYSNSGNLFGSYSDYHGSTQFKSNLKQLYPELVDEFKQNGTLLDHFYEELEVKNVMEIAKKKTGIVKKVFKMMKKVFGLEKINYK